jgi:hypothetical protein
MPTQQKIGALVSNFEGLPGQRQSPLSEDRADEKGRTKDREKA